MLSHTSIISGVRRGAWRLVKTLDLTSRRGGVKIFFRNFFRARNFFERSPLSRSQQRGCKFVSQLRQHALAQLESMEPRHWRFKQLRHFVRPFLQSLSTHDSLKAEKFKRRQVEQVVEKLAHLVFNFVWKWRDLFAATCVVLWWIISFQHILLVLRVLVASCTCYTLVSSSIWASVTY